ncbi:hypothetical protein X798_02935 [Onchocerca flexuosa]|uniref:Uncharacterized protein n=1 Tax=Onchocerca flexuosa TaxID=387005 RepID=A0A238BZ53_9BILA|nr:hypothetical protein X798_02935 [Onchocerca flexuosa]
MRCCSLLSVFLTSALVVSTTAAKRSVEFNNITITIEKGLYENNSIDRLGSISLVNVGDGMDR